MATTPILPCITAPAERKNFLEAINLVSLGEQPQTLPNEFLTTDNLPEAADLARTLVSLNNNNPNQTQQPPTSPPRTAIEIEIGLKAARFFAALLRFMIQGPPDVLDGAIPYPCRTSSPSRTPGSPPATTRPISPPVRG
jgi:hypothetical protein